MKLFLRKIVLSSFLLYFFNVFFDFLGFIIPINAFTIFITSLLGFAGFVGLIAFKYIFL